MFASLLILSAYYQLTTVDGERHLKAVSSPTACKSCEAVIVLPPRCSFECQDAVLSGQGTTVVKGTFQKSQFLVDAAFDTWRAQPLPRPLLKVTSSDAQCAEDTCTGHFTVTNLDSGKSSAVKTLFFGNADDVNYQLEASRALPSLQSIDGLLMTGSTKKQKLTAKFVFRPWISEQLCDPAEKAKSLAIPAGAEDYEFRVLSNEAEAIPGEEGRTLYWILPGEADVASATYTTGINDLWAQKVRIDRTTCAVTVLAEH